MGVKMKIPCSRFSLSVVGWWTLWLSLGLFASAFGYIIVTNEPRTESKEFIKLPIFPLQKSARFPTDPLTLNLYEERYLDMSKYILQNPIRLDDDNRRNGFLLFGALYTSDKAHVVGENGRGPIVPILQVDHVGTIFQVNHSHEAMVPTPRGDRRRRIRLEATGICRFQIKEILYNGFSKTEKCPFIMAKVAIYQDHNDMPDTQFEQRIHDLSRQCLDPNRKRLAEKKPNDGENVENSVSRKDWLEPGLGNTMTTVVVPASHDGDLEQTSFALASTVFENSSPRERMEILKGRCRRERLDKITAKLPKPTMFGGNLANLVHRLSIRNRHNKLWQE